MSVRVSQIGKGTFSKVYLCKYTEPQSTLFRMSVMNSSINSSTSDFDPNSYFICKEINIDILVSKYTKTTNSTKSQSVSRTPKKNGGLDYITRTLKTLRILPKSKKSGSTSNSVNPKITPYSKSNNSTSIEFDEYEYYYKRLRELIESEIEVLNSCTHENIIKFYNHSFANPIYELNMEYCNLGDLYAVLYKDNDSNNQNKKDNRSNNKDNNNSNKKDNSNNLDIERNMHGGFCSEFIIAFIHQVSSGLEYLHSKYIIHRDIKLPNILIKQQRDLSILFVISDFGFACYDISDKECRQWLETHTTIQDRILSKKYFKLCGTPYYMAPEIITNMNLLENFTHYQIAPRTKKQIFYGSNIDMWSLGICLYELIYCKLPFPSIRKIEDLESYFRKQDAQHDIYGSISKPTDLTPHYYTVLLRLLTVEKSERITSAQVKNMLGERVVVYKLKKRINNDQLITSQVDQFVKNIVREPIVTEPLSEEWEDLCPAKTDENSLLFKMSLEDNFAKWLQE